MKYLIFCIPLIFLYACDSKSSCFLLTGEDVALSLEMRHSLKEENIHYTDTLELTISFPEEMINSKNSERFDISPYEPSFALFIKDRAPTIFPNQSPLYLESAKDQFLDTVLQGEKINTTDYLLSNVSEAISIRPVLSQGQYSLSVQLLPITSGEYLIYWNYLHRDFLLLDGEREQDLPACKNLIKVEIKNTGSSNLQLASDNERIQENPDLVDELGLFLFTVGN